MSLFLRLAALGAAILATAEPAFAAPWIYYPPSEQTHGKNALQWVRDDQNQTFVFTCTSADDLQLLFASSDQGAMPDTSHSTGLGLEVLFPDHTIAEDAQLIGTGALQGARTLYPDYTLKILNGLLETSGEVTVTITAVPSLEKVSYPFPLEEFASAAVEFRTSCGA